MWAVSAVIAVIACAVVAAPSAAQPPGPRIRAADVTTATPTAPLRADESSTFYYLPASTVKITDGDWPAATSESKSIVDKMSYARRLSLSQALAPRGVLDGPGEIYAEIGPFRADASRFGDFWSRYLPAPTPEETFLAIRVPKGKPAAGRLYLPKADLSGMIALRFAAGDAPTTQANAYKDFLEARLRHYERLMWLDAPGGAWFRHQAHETAALLGRTLERAPAAGPRWITRDMTGELVDTYALFTGGRALTENLQIDRVLNVDRPATPSVAIDSIRGITVQEIKWKELVKDLKPEPDPLAAVIPVDQHAIFFPSFQAMLDVLDEARLNGTPILRLLEPRPEDAQTNERYERQLCLQPDVLSRMLGPKVVTSVAFTGSDPYLRTGSDVAVIFEAPNIEALRTLLSARHAQAMQANPGAEAVKGDIDGVAYTGVVSPGRAVCSYLAALEKAVVVTNSLAQLRRIVETSKGKTPAMGSADEYVFFRNRYKRGEADELACVLLTDAAIRRWCGPRWRIASSRRTRVAAAMSELQARHLDALASRTAKSELVPADIAVPNAGEVRLKPYGVESSVYGTLDFMTPIVELPLDKATSPELAAYEFFRNRYQSNWRQFFDPIAIRFTVRPDRVGADVSVMPLIFGSDYNRFIELTRGKPIAPGAGDPHAEALAHFVMSLNPESEAMRFLNNFGRQLMPTVQIEPFAWTGAWFTVFADSDPFWQDLAKALREQEPRNDLGKFIEGNIHRLPLALEAEVANPLKLTAFLAALRGYIDQAAPGMLTWETRKHGERDYVRVSLTKKAIEEFGQEEEAFTKAALYYAPTPRVLILTLNEDVLKRALDRLAAARKSKQGGDAGTTATSTPAAGAPAAMAWLGESLALHIKEPARDMILSLVRESYENRLQIIAWNAIPILNEWRRRYPSWSPLELQERFWQTRLVSPAGGSYVWNEEWQTMESTLYGHPGRPKAGPPLPPAVTAAKSGNFGLTFENQGLRARAVILREPKK
jgi:hypothetical protein